MFQQRLTTLPVMFDMHGVDLERYAHALRTPEGLRILSNLFSFSWLGYMSGLRLKTCRICPCLFYLTGRPVEQMSNT